MDNDERKILDALIKMYEQLLYKVSRFVMLIMALLVIFVISFSLLIGYVVKSNNDMMEECTRLYFETNYLYPETDMTQTIGDITNEITETSETTETKKD